MRGDEERLSVTKIGVLDWGVGGFGAVRALRDLGVPHPLLYVSDSGSVPYGRMDATSLRRRLERLCAWMEARGCEVIVVACNAASTTLADLRGNTASVVGMIDCTVAHLAEKNYPEIGLLGGQRTVESESYPRALQRRSCETRVRAQVAQPLSALVEEGILEGAEVDAKVDEIVAPLRDVEVMVSACTRYAPLRKTTAARIPSLRVWIEPAELVVASLVERGVVSASPRHPRRPWAADDQAWTSGNLRGLQRAARVAFGVQVGDVQRLPV